MHWKAPSVREKRQAVVALSNSVPAINSCRAELSSLWYGRHAMLYGACNASREPS